MRISPILTSGNLGAGGMLWGAKAVKTNRVASLEIVTVVIELTIQIAIVPELPADHLNLECSSRDVYLTDVAEMRVYFAARPSD
jgi:hypothetical protein